MATEAYEVQNGLRDELGVDWQLPTWRKLQHLRLYGTEVVADAAEAAYDAAWHWGEGIPGLGNTGESEAEFDVAAAELLKRIRADLHIPGGSIDSLRS
jgi:hypothetical protein